MRIASFVGQKGGVGKSTLARVLAVAAARAQHKVLIGDFDLEQLTCVEWGALRMRNGVEPEIEARAFKSLKKLRKTVEGYDLVVVDTRGLADELTEDVSRESDVVFLPTGTSMDDLRPTLALARKLSKTRAVGKKIVIVLSKTGRSERLLEQAEATIAELVSTCSMPSGPSVTAFKPTWMWAAPAASPATPTSRRLLRM